MVGDTGEGTGCLAKVCLGLRWKLNLFHLPLPFRDSSLCRYFSFYLSGHPCNGVNIYYPYPQRQDLLIGNQPLHCSFQFPPKCHLCEEVPSSPCSGCCPYASSVPTADQHTAPGVGQAHSPVPCGLWGNCVCLAIHSVQRTVHAQCLL